MPTIGTVPPSAHHSPPGPLSAAARQEPADMAKLGNRRLQSGQPGHVRPGASFFAWSGQPAHMRSVDVQAHSLLGQRIRRLEQPADTLHQAHGRFLPKATELLDLGRAVSRLNTVKAEIEKASGRASWWDRDAGPGRVKLEKRLAACQRQVDALADPLVERFRSGGINVPISTLYRDSAMEGGLSGPALRHLDQCLAGPG